MKQLHQLDFQKAVELGLAEVKVVENEIRPLTLEDGWARYLEYSGRSAVLGGVAPNTFKRYRLVQKHHVGYCRRHGLGTWVEFDKSRFEKYGNWMFAKFAYRTCYVDLTQIKSVINWFISEGLLPAGCKIHYPLRKAEGSDTFCYSSDEVSAMIDHCGASSKLTWLHRVIVALSHLGLRIGELIGLRWTDIDLKAQVVRIADERASSRKSKTGMARTTKGRRDRIIPLHPTLIQMLLTIPRHKDGRVFHSARGAALRENNALKIFKEQVIQPLAKGFPTTVGEIGFEHGTFHSFRHFFCSQCFLGGASEGEVREWLGHRDSKIVELYRHLRNDDARRKMNQIDFLGRGEESRRPRNTA